MVRQISFGAFMGFRVLLYVVVMLCFKRPTLYWVESYFVAVLTRALL